MRVGIGIDTGGTFTDCVVVDLDRKKIVAKAKMPTTYSDLRIGITRSLDAATAAIPFGKCGIRAVSLSTTLATNAIIEGRGARVGTLLIGMDTETCIPSDQTVVIKGGHCAAPDGGIIENEPLDEEAVERACVELMAKVDAFAIIESFGNLCPEHELRARETVRRVTGLPATCGHELSTELGFYERAVTAALNSKLIPLLTGFINAVESELEARNINAPVYIVKSDGTLTTSAMAKERPVETILTGPAASVIGARYMTDMTDLIMVDQGGTTCLTSVIKGGWPTLVEDGATIASYRTRVRALKIRAIGLGGDSHIRVDSGSIEIGPRRLIPLCVASLTMPNLKEKMADIGDTYFLRCPESGPEAQEEVANLMEKMKDLQPATVAEIAKCTGLATSSMEAALRKLINDRAIEEIGLTVTDILHCSGKYTAYDQEASKIGVSILARKAGLSEQQFINKVESLIVDRICKEIVLAHLESPDSSSVISSDRTLDTLLNNYSADLHLEGFVKSPIVAAGACSYAFIQDVARRMHADCSISENSDVCNAFGCIVGAVVERVTISVRKTMYSSEASMSNGSSGNYQLLYPGTCENYGSKEEAVDRARALSAEIAYKKAQMSGAVDIAVSIEVKEHTLPIRSDWTGGSTEAIWTGGEVTATAIGQPAYWRS
jgi:N-methylhydantoinase A/oxoprolinase/acetone carboxylase beta subunit